jgi:hypothetical protein
MKVDYLLASWLTESFYGIEIRSNGYVCKKMKKQMKKVCCFRFVVKAGNEGWNPNCV